MPERPDPDATGAYRPDPPSPPTAPAERFAPGVLLASRYRIVAPLGKGGMGEVYRADDLLLAQPVALKFLPEHIAHDPDRLARFRKEVAAARKVSHPNVCRVYDIVEYDGQSFLTMEFVDGEDLSSVLKRLGRVPEEKGIEIARQQCGALAAVHDQGLLHRDLKPANVMLDGRGQTRLTDFGLAAAAADLSASDVRSGTPLYQAPEQLAGRDVTVRSDVYALGLVLYELFTGTRAFTDARRDAAPSKPSSHVSHLNPAVEAVILRCLEPDPANRPRSAVEVMAVLPGSDPLAAALAAGQTPSPQLVADAGGTGLISGRFGAVLFALVVGSFVLLTVAAERQSVYRRAEIAASPAEMARTAQVTLGTLGYSDPPVDSVARYEPNWEWLEPAQQRDPDWVRKVGSRPGGLVLFYRASAEPMAPDLFSPAPPPTPGVIQLYSPPVTPGTTAVRLDPRGRLVEFVASLPYRPNEPATPTGDDWAKPLFASADLDLQQFKSTEPLGTCPVACDRHSAWIGTWGDGSDAPVRVESAARGGKPVWFRAEVVRPNTPATGPPPAVTGGAGCIISLLLGLAFVFGVRNLLRGQADRVTALRLFALVLSLPVVFWIIGGHHTKSARTEFNALFQMCAIGIFVGGFAALAYLGLEPTVRRRWPWRLTAWNRLFAGRWRDPMVGRDFLIGLAAGAAVWAAHAAVGLTGESLNVPMPWRAIGMEEAYPPSPLLAVYGSLQPVFLGATFQLFWAFCIFLAVRREWLTWLIYAAVFWFVWFTRWSDRVTPDAMPAAVAQSLLLPVVFTFVLARYGLLAILGLGLTGLFAHIPFTFDTSAWYFPQAVIGTGLFVALAGFCCWTATGSRPLFKEGFFGDD